MEEPLLYVYRNVCVWVVPQKSTKSDSVAAHIFHILMCLGMEVPIKMNGFQKGRLRALFRAKDHKVKVCLWFWSSWKFLVPFLNHIYCFWCWLLSTLILFGLIWVWSSQKSFKNQGLKNCWITLRILISRYVQRMIWSRSHAFILSSKKKETNSLFHAKKIKKIYYEILKKNLLTLTVCLFIALARTMPVRRSAPTSPPLVKNF